MEQFNHHQPPQWALRLFRMFCHPDFVEEIEGDLVEKYQLEVTKRGLKAAQWQFYSEILQLLKPNLIFNLNRYAIMKTQNWTILLIVVFSFVLASVAPFLPGPTNDISHNISKFAQIIGYIGLFLMPFGLLWLIIEIRNKKDQKLNKWTNGYYPALLTISPFLLLILVQIRAGLQTGGEPVILPFATMSLILAFIFYQIQKLKNKTTYKFNVAPVYIVLLPLAILLTSKFAIEKAATYCRENVIEKTEPVIVALEKYKTAQGNYPEKLEDLVGTYIPAIPTFNIMGINAYQYEKRNNTFQLSFEQNWHWSATDVVVYVKNGHKIMKSKYENFATSHPNWRYFYVD